MSEIGRLDLLLRGGHVIDPANDIDAPMDVGIRGGRIAAVAADLAGAESEHTVDVSGLVVTPGLLDIHIHCYHTRSSESRREGKSHRSSDGLFSGSLNAEAHFLKQGVTTCVDTGSAGCEEFEHFRKLAKAKLSLESAVSR